MLVRSFWREITGSGEEKASENGHNLNNGFCSTIDHAGYPLKYVTKATIDNIKIM